MGSNDISYIASGFQEDCIKLIDTFKNNPSIRFNTFCNAWKETKFSLVFLCRKNYAEMLEFCEEALNIAKHFLLSPTELVDQIGGLYLLYGIYYKIPIENVKIRVTLREWQKLLNFHALVKDEKLYDASYIFIKLITDNAFHHCLFSNEYGLEKCFKMRLDHSFDNPHSILPNIVDEIENGELAKVQKISDKYDEQKTKIMKNLSSTNKLQLFDKRFLHEIINDIELLQDKRQTLTGLRKKSKGVTFYNKAEKLKYNNEDKIRPKLGHGFDTDSSDDENMDMEFAFVKADESNFEKTFKDFDNDDDNDDNDDNDDDFIKKLTDDKSTSKMEYNTEDSDNYNMS